MQVGSSFAGNSGRGERDGRLSRKPGRWPAWRYAFRVGALSVALGFFFLPIVFLFSTSFKSPDQVLLGTFFPAEPGLDNWTKAFEIVDLTGYVWRSLLISVASAILTLLIAVPAAYAVVRLQVGAALGSITLGSYIAPPVVALLPLFFLLRKLELLNSFPGMILVYGLMNAPVAYWLMRGFIKEVPRALDEAAWIDGAGYLKTFLVIDLPLLVPSMISTALIAGILAYNEFLFASAFAQNPSVRGLTVGISLFQGERLVNFGQMAVASIAGIVPIYLIALLMQNRLVGGLTAGAVK
ncbi:carbohydrate ABC transporter permease [Mesorhizobium sp. DCY119]|nr:carbohydrate ABC transporter permease [Mesorhizobium sp. DCY119]